MVTHSLVSRFGLPVVLMLLLSSAMPAAPAGRPAAPEAAWTLTRVDNGRWFDMTGPGLALDPAGRPHLAYGGDALYYTYHDGSSWHDEEVSGLETGMYASLAVDAAGHPHVAFMGGNEEHTSSALKYAYHDGTAWSITTVDDAEAAGSYTSIAVDGAGRPHISYLAYDGLRYATYDGAAWQVEHIAGAYWATAIAVDAAGRPHVAYLIWPNRHLAYATRGASGWEIQVVHADWAGSPSIAVDPDGQPAIVYARIGGLYLARYDGSAWASAAVDGLGTPYYDSLAFDAAGRPRIAYIRDQVLLYAAHDGTAWQIEEVASPAGPGSVLRLDSAGQPLVAYFSDDGCLRLARRGAPGWQAEAVDCVRVVGSDMSLALDPAGLPHISYRDRKDEALRYAYLDGTAGSAAAASSAGAAWHTMAVGPMGWEGSGTSIAVDPGGRPHIAYVGPDYRSLQYASYDGTASFAGAAWLTTTVVTSPWSIAHPALALDAAGRPRIAYGENGARLHYAWDDGAGWQDEWVGPGGLGTSLALDAAGRPYISTYDESQDAVLYFFHDGAAWQYEVVAYDWAYGAANTSLALDAAGRPHIAFWATPDHGLRCAYRDGGGWHLQTIDADGYAGGESLSLAVDDAGLLHTSYSSWYGLRLAHFDGASWVTETVDSRTSAGYDNALAVDAAGGMYIGYWYLNGGDLMVAEQGCVAPAGVAVAGPALLSQGVPGLYSAATMPISATFAAFTWDNGTIGPTAPYSWTVTGTHGLAVTATNACGMAAGGMTVTVFCEPPAGVQIAGPALLVAGREALYRAAALPITTSRPLTFTWSNGQVGPAATYSWTLTGTYTITVDAANACGEGSGAFRVEVPADWPYHLFLPLAVPAPAADD